MYYLQKSAVYLHGTFWIGDSLQEGIDKASTFANNDIDGYHDWEVCKYTEGLGGHDAEVVYTINKEDIQEER